jgi:hypothetical protein
MKKVSKILFLAIVLSSSMALTSCKKCLECEVLEEHGDHNHSEMADEMCGSKKDRENFEKEYRAKHEGEKVECAIHGH